MSTGIGLLGGVADLLSLRRLKCLFLRHDDITAPEPGFIHDRRVCRRCWRVTT